MITPTLQTQVKALIERNIIMRKLDENYDPSNEHLIESEEWSKLSTAVKLLEQQYKNTLS